MSKKYMIRPGFTFVDHQNTVKGGGEIIELEDDIAALHLHKLEEPPAPKKAPKAAKPVTAETPATGNGDDAAAGDAGAAATIEQPAGPPAGEEA
jgi:hypothetical protein